jgi:hypothetical protein
MKTTTTMAGSDAAPVNTTGIVKAINSRTELAIRNDIYRSV